MAINAASGTISVPSSAATDSVVSGLAFRPNVVFLFGTNATADGTFTAAPMTAFGFVTRTKFNDVAGSIGATFGVEWQGDDGNTTPTWNAFINTLFQVLNAAGSARYKATDIRLNSDGFTIDWQNVTSGMKVGWLALGGDVQATWGTNLTVDAQIDIDDFVVGDRFTIPIQQVPWQPSGLIVLANDGFDPSMIYAEGIGFVGSGGVNHHVAMANEFGSDPSDAYRRLSTTNSIVLMDARTGAVGFSAKVSRMEPHQITFEVTTAPASDFHTIDIFVCALGGDGVGVEVGHFAKSTGAAPASQTVTVKGRPQAGIFFHTSDTNLDSSQAHARMGLGGFSWDGASTYTDIATAHEWDDNAGTSSGSSYYKQDRAIAVANNGTPSLDAIADVTSTAMSQINLSWTTNNAVATQIGFMSFFPVSPILATTTAVDVVGNNAVLKGGASLVGNDLILVRGNEAFIGNSSVGTHMIAGATDLAVTGNSSPLRLDHTGKLSGATALDIAASFTFVPADHALTGVTDAITVVGNASPLNQPGADLVGALTIDLTENAARLNIGDGLGVWNALSGNDFVTLDAETLGILGIGIPFPSQEPDSIPGTVNLYRNPSFEHAFEASDIAAVGASVTITQDISQSWHGGFSAKIDLPNATSRGVRFTSQRGLGLSGNPETFLAEFRIKGAGDYAHTWQITPRVFYTDTTSDAGTTVVKASIVDDTWETVQPAALTVDPDKFVDYFAVDVVRAEAAASESFFVDGLQMELDKGYGHTPWVYGGYGSPYHEWQGADDLSFSIRFPIPLDSDAPSRGGIVEIIPEVWKVDANNDKIEDLTRYFEAGTVTVDPERDVSWTFQATISGEGYKKIEPFVDWLAPYFTLKYADGSKKTGQIGHFVVMPSTRTVTEYDETVDIDGRSGEVLLAMQGTKGIVLVKENTHYMKAVREILNATHLGVDGKKFRYHLPDGNGRAHRDMTWDRKEDSLTVVNDLLRKAGCHPIYAGNDGYLLSRNRKKKRYKHMHPVRLWAANLPDDVELDTFQRRLPKSTNEVVGSIQLETDLDKFDSDNKIVVVSVNPKKGRVRVVRYINDPKNPISTKKRKKLRERKVHADVGTNADAEDLAEAIADEISSDVDTTTISVIPDPTVQLIREVVFLAVYNGNGEPIAVGRYKVKTITYGFTPDECLMKMTLGFVHEVDELEGGAGLEDIGFKETTIWDIGAA